MKEPGATMNPILIFLEIGLLLTVIFAYGREE